MIVPKSLLAVSVVWIYHTFSEWWFSSHLH